MRTTGLLLIAALIVGWPYPAHRSLLMVTIFIAILGVVFTLVYIYPINADLMGEPGHEVGAAVHGDYSRSPFRLATAHPPQEKRRV